MTTNLNDAASAALQLLEDFRSEVPLFLVELGRRGLPAPVVEPVTAMAEELARAAATYRTLVPGVPTPPDVTYEPCADMPTTAAFRVALRQLRGLVDRNQQLQEEFDGDVGSDTITTVGQHLTRALASLADAAAGVPDETFTAVLALASSVDPAGMGPITTWEAGSTAVRIGIPLGYPLKARVLRRWADRMSDARAVLYRRRVNSIEVRLEVHGTLAGVPVVVHTTYDRKDEAAQVEAILAALESTQPLNVLDTLGEQEIRAGAGHRVGVRP